MKLLVAALALAASLAACNSDQTGDSNTDNQNEQPPQPTVSSS